MDVPLFGLLGMAGVFVVFMWFVSLHAVTKQNITILWVLPTHIGLAWVLLRSRGGRWLSAYLWATTGLVVVFALGWPFWTQEVSVTLLFLALASGVRSAGLALGLRGDREETASVP